MPLTERLAVLIETIGTSSVVKDLNKVAGATQGLGGEAAKSTKLFAGLGQSAQQMGGMLADAPVAAAVAAGTAIVAFGVKSIKTFVDLGQEVLKFQRASGATAEQASALVAAFDDVGISAETGAKSMFQLGKRLETSASTLADFGVTAVKGADGNTDLAATLLEVADAYNNTQDPAQRAALVAAAFGKSAQEMIPILERGRAGIQDLFAGAEESGQILSPEQVQQAEDFRLAMDELNDTIREFGLVVGSAAVPAVTKLVGILSGAIAPIAEGLRLTLRAIGLGGHDAAGGIDMFAGSAENAASGAQILSDDVDDLQDSLLGLGNAERARDQAVRSVTSAEERVGQARQKVNDILAKGAVDLDKVTSATEDLARANRSLEDATRRAGDAQERLLGLQQELADLTSGKVGAEKVKDAQDDLTRAQLRQRGATNRVAEAQVKYNEAALDTETTAHDLAAAQLDLDQANFDLTQANEDVTTAQEAVTAAEKVGAENSPEVIAKRREIEGATDDLAGANTDLATATNGVTTATENLSRAQSGDTVQYNKDLASARGDLKTAEEGLATARGTLGQRTWDLVNAQEAFNLKMIGADTTAGFLRDKLESIVRKQPELASFLDPLIADLDSANTKLGGAINTLTGLGQGLQKAGGLAPGVDPLLGFLSGYIASRPNPGNLSPLLPHAAAGGVATKPTLGIWGEAGPEALIPLDRMGDFGGGGTTVNFYVNGFVGPGAEAAFADAVQNALLAKQRRGGGLGFAA